jgi:hypothetical protein
VAASGLLALALTGGAEAGDPCDPALVARGADRRPLSYAARGDRCEGLYAQDVAAGSVLTVVSFTARFEDFVPGPDGHLQVAWPAGLPGEVQIRAQGRRPRLYYRMDTVRPPGPPTYAWRTNVLSDLRLRRDDIGVIAWARLPMGGRERLVYLPLRIGTTGGAPGGAPYSCVLVPGAELDEVFWSLVALDGTGRPAGTPTAPRELGHGGYPAGRAFTARIPPPARPGLHRLELTDVQRNGASTSTDLLFVHAAAP